MTHHELLQMRLEIVWQWRWQYRLRETDLVSDRPSEFRVQKEQSLRWWTRNEIQPEVIRADKRTVDQKRASPERQGG